jgi:hypothetical protein
MNELVLTGPIVGILCTISLLIGFLTGNRDREMDTEIMAAEEWHQAVASALWVARRTNPDSQETSAFHRHI